MTAAIAPNADADEQLAPECIAMPVEDVLRGDCRLDAEMYLADGYSVRHEIAQSSLTTEPLGQIAKIWQPGRQKSIQVQPAHGIAFLAATQVFDIWPAPRKWLAAGRTRDVSELYVELGWILVTCVRGPSATRSSPIRPTKVSLISSDILRVQPQANMRGYLYAFLRTRHGRAMMKSTHYGSIIKHVRPSHLENLQIPIIDRIVRKTGREIDSVFELRDRAYRLDIASRARFSEAMSKRPKLAREEGYGVAASHLFEERRRFEAGAHSPASHYVLRTYERNATTMEALGNVARAFVPGRFKRIFGASGTLYLDSAPIFKINPELTKRLTPATAIDFDAYRVRSGWLLMACSGQTYGINGQAILASGWHEGKVITQHVMRIVPDREQIRPGYLQTVLSHPTLGKPLVVSRAYGTSVPELAPADIESLTIPRLATSIEDEIANGAERASELRMKADTKENGAVARLEEELESELGKSGGKKKHGPLRIPLDFDEAMKRAVQVPPPDEAEA